MVVSFLELTDWAGGTSPIYSLFPAAHSLEGRTTCDLKDRRPRPASRPADSDGPEVALGRCRSRRSGLRVVPPVAQLVDNTNDAVELSRQSGQYLDIALSVNVARQGDDVPANLDANTFGRGHEHRW